MFKGVQPIRYAGREVLPLIEGGKGVSATNHASSGAWAAAGGIGTVSAVNADSYDPEGKIIPQVYHALTRRDRAAKGPVTRNGRTIWSLRTRSRTPGIRSSAASALSKRRFPT